MIFRLRTLGNNESWKTKELGVVLTPFTTREISLPDIILHQIRKTYPNGAIGLSATELSVADRECFVLLGPSGSGKTTLLRTIAGLEMPDAGELRIGGIRVDQLPPHERGISLVTQRPALYPHQNVAENLAIGLRFEESNRSRKDRIPEAEITERVREAADQLGIAELLKRRVHELSGGEQRRVALGRALVSRRKIWLLDEPFSQLDTPLRDRLCRELHLLRRALGLTIILVTHDSNEAMALADRVGVFGEGRLLQVGKSAEVLARPCHRTVAFCFGWPTINWIEGRTAEILVGVRPEDLRLDAVPNGIKLGGGEVIASRPFAGSWLTDVQLNSRILRSIGPAHEVGRIVELWVEKEKRHEFDVRSGKRFDFSN